MLPYIKALFWCIRKCWALDLMTLPSPAGIGRLKASTLSYQWGNIRHPAENRDLLYEVTNIKEKLQKWGVVQALISHIQTCIYLHVSWSHHTMAMELDGLQLLKRSLVRHSKDLLQLAGLGSSSRLYCNSQDQRSPIPLQERRSAMPLDKCLICERMCGGNSAI